MNAQFKNKMPQIKARRYELQFANTLVLQLRCQFVPHSWWQWVETDRTQTQSACACDICDAIANSSIRVNWDLGHVVWANNLCMHVLQSKKR